MDTKMKDGGPAFATSCAGEPKQHLQEGMSLRDWFAGQAPPMPNDYRSPVPYPTSTHPGYLSEEQRESAVEVFNNYQAAKIAEWNYRYADAMLRARTGENSQ